MGWLKNIYKFFFKDTKDIPKSEIVHINDLPEWLELQLKEIVGISNLDEDLLNYVNQLKDKRWLLECKLDEWEKKSKVSPFYDEIKAIFLETRKLLDYFNFSNEIQLSTLFKLNHKINPLLENLIKRIEESDFFSEYSFMVDDSQNDPYGELKNIHVNPLLRELLDLSSFKRNFEDKVDKSGLNKVQVLNDKVINLSKNDERIRFLSKELEAKKLRLKSSEQKIKDKEEQLKILKESSEYNSLEDVKNRKKNLSAQLEKKEDEVFTFFSKLKSVLKQYLPFTDDVLVFSYIKDSVNTFYQDKNLEILNILLEIKDALLSERVRVDSEEKNNLLGLIEKADSGYLEQINNEQNQIKEELLVLNKTNVNHDFLLKVEDAQYRFNHFSKLVQKLRSEVEELEEEVNSCNALKLREVGLFQNLVAVSLNKNIEIKTSVI